MPARRSGPRGSGPRQWLAAVVALYGCSWILAIAWQYRAVSPGDRRHELEQRAASGADADEDDARVAYDPDDVGVAPSAAISAAALVDENDDSDGNDASPADDDTDSSANENGEAESVAADESSRGDADDADDAHPSSLTTVDITALPPSSPRQPRSHHTTVTTRPSNTGACATRSRTADPPPTVGLPSNASDALGGGGNIFVHRGNADALMGAAADDDDARARVRSTLPPSMEAITDTFAFQSCAVVGNGGALLHSRYGAAIDAHSTVWRVNQGPTQGYEQHVGSRTHLRVVNVLWASRYARGAKLEVDRGLVAPLPLERGVTLVASRANASEYDELFRGVRQGARLHASQEERASRGGVVEFVGGVKRTDVSLLWLSHRVVGLARRWLEGYRRRLCASGFGSAAAALPRGGGGAAAEAGSEFKGAPPSSGFVAAYAAMQLCAKVSLYGFGLQYAGPTKRVTYHYYKGFGARDMGTQRDDGTQVHAWELEGAAVEALARARRIALCRHHPGEASRLWVRYANEACGWPIASAGAAQRARRAAAMAEELRWRFVNAAPRRGGA